MRPEYHRFSDMAGAGHGLGAERHLLTTEDNAAAISDLQAAVDVGFVLFCGALVFLMQGGFAMLEAGSIRAKNAKNILLKNLLDPCIAAMVWWAVGFPFAFGEHTGGNGFIGANNFFLATLEEAETVTVTYPMYLRGFAEGGFTGYEFWFFQWAFAATAATIVSGAVAERCRFCAYLVYVAVLTGFIYPVVVHWVWSGEGWLSAFNSGTTSNLVKGAFDFAGSSVVHMTGGVAALVAATILGPRLGRFDSDGKVVDIQPHSLPLAALGVFMLWFGWYGFNPGSALGLSGGYYYTAAKVAATTTLSGAAGGFMVLVILVGVPSLHLDLAPIVNGILAGLVAICAGAAVVEPWASVVIGAIGAPVMLGASFLLKMLKIDDPLDAAPVHMFAGIWGMIACGLFATETNAVAVYGFAETDGGDKYYGAFYGGGGRLLGVQIVTLLAVLGWVGATSIILFGLLRVSGLFRISEDDETVGLDVSHHGGAAYEWQAAGNPEASDMKPAKVPSKVAEPEPEVEMVKTTDEPAAES